MFEKTFKKSYLLFTLIASFLLVVSCIEQSVDPEKANLHKGDPAPVQEGLDLQTLSSKTTGEYYGKPLLINFFATWCAPCVREMKSLQEFHQKSGIDVLLVNVQTAKKQKEILSFLERKGVSLPCIIDDSLQISRTFGIEAFPETYLVTADGKIAEFVDPQSKTSGVVIRGARSWGSEKMISAVKLALEEPK